MDPKKIIYYYQTFSSLKPLILTNIKNICIYASSLHFGRDTSGAPYLNLNDSAPEQQTYVLMDLENANLNGITIMVMLGGAGGAYGALFRDFDAYYQLLYLFLKKYPFIKGIDLDVEEPVTLPNIQLLIKCLDRDFGKKFIITMAPISPSMSSDNPGMGGFSYKKLYQSWQGQRINWFNVQCYGNYTAAVYQSIIENGYPADKIVFGMLGDSYNPANFPAALNEIKRVSHDYVNMGGVCLWEYGDTTIDPIVWGLDIDKIFI